MALQFAHGDIAWNSADAVNTIYTVSGLAFQPKALMFWITGLPDGTDAASQTVSGRVCIGFATSTSDRRCQGFLSVDAGGSADCQEIYRADAVVATVSSAVAVDGLLDMNSITSDGFTLIVDDTAPINLRVFWFAWGGSDIINAATGEIVEPAATGNQSTTVTGWKVGNHNNVVMFAGCQLTAAAPTVLAQDAGLMFGAATGTATGDQFVHAINEDDGSANMDCDSYVIDSECLAMMTVAGGNPNARGAFNGFTASGFDINWTAQAVSNRRYIYLAIQGGMWKAGGVVFNDTGGAGSTVTVSGLKFRPVGSLLVARPDAKSSAGASNLVSWLSVGCFSSLSSRRAMGYFSEDGTANTEIDLAVEYDETIAIPDAVGSMAGTATAVDINAINADGFQLISDVSRSISFYIAYLAFGSVDWLPKRTPYGSEMRLRR